MRNYARTIVKDGSFDERVTPNPKTHAGTTVRTYVPPPPSLFPGVELRALARILLKEKREPTDSRTFHSPESHFIPPRHHPTNANTPPHTPTPPH